MLSISSICGRIFEIFINQTLEPNVSGILNDEIFGYRTGKGTTDAVEHIIDRTRFLKKQMKGNKIALVAIDLKGAFDNISHDAIINGLHLTNATDDTIDFFKSYLRGRSEYIKLGDHTSEIWNASNHGVGQGRPCASYLFNCGAYARYQIGNDKSSAKSIYADDQMAVVLGKTDEKLIDNILIFYKENQRYFSNIGMQLQPSKTEILPLNCGIRNLEIEGQKIKTKAVVTFLGYQINKNLDTRSHVTKMNIKIRKIASKMRKFHDLTIQQRKLLYVAWVQGSLMSNGKIYLPLLNKSETRKLQVACNIAIRAIIKKNVKDYMNMEKVRVKLNIASIEQLKMQIIMTHAWKKRESYKLEIENRSGAYTRSTTAQMLLKERTDVYNTKERDAFNLIPLNIRNMNNEDYAKKQIKILTRMQA